VDLTAGAVEIYRAPAGDKYADATKASQGMVAMQALPGPNRPCGVLSGQRSTDPRSAAKPTVAPPPRLG
jgi:hypothetical protein